LLINGDLWKEFSVFVSRFLWLHLSR
jgi:hypothetical protein